MRTSTKIWLITAVSLILIGGIIFVGVMTMLKWDFTKLSTNRFESNRYELTEDFSDISIQTDTADIVFVPTDGDCTVLCFEQKNVKHTVAVENGTLVIRAVDTRKWYEHIGINFTSPGITVSIPRGAYNALTVDSHTGNVEIPEDFSFDSIAITERTGNVTSHASVTGAVKIRTTTGKIRVENATAETMELSVSTGRVTLSGVSVSGDLTVRVSTGNAELSGVACKNLTTGGSTGDVTLRRVIVDEKISVERSTGNVRFEASDAAEIFVRTDTGNVSGTLCSPKVFDVKTDTGKKSYPNTTTGGRCEITTDTGNIRIEIEDGIS